MAEEKIYCGSGKQIQDYDMYSINLCLTDIPEEFINEFQGKQYVKLTLGKLKKNVEYEGKLKKTHWLAVDTYKPDKKETREPAELTDEQKQGNVTELNPDDLPF